LTPPTDAPDARRLTRIPILVGSLIVALCAGGAAMATAQTTTATDDPEGAQTTSPAEDEGAAAEEAGGTEGSAPDSTDTAAEEQQAAQARATPRLKRARVKPSKLFLRSGRRAEFVFELGGGDANVRVKAMKKGSGGKVVRRWKLGEVQANQRHRIRWNGSVKGGGKAPKGRYRFRVEGGNGESLARGKVDGRRTLGIYPAKFPVRGRHQYWDGWGAGRGHQGQDIGARCGTKMVAAEAGRVAFRGFDGGGYGHYLAINVRGSNRAHIYAHLKRKAKVGRGKRVRTGQEIGKVGASGNATGCHLHFEYWRGSWRRGHATRKATKKLRKWDKWS
jgi:murein DD-endopeptidase MepM/ murein hydrolase activator NlpD